MKAVIIGGGIAGLTLAAWLTQQENWEVSIYERNEPIKAKGHAFLIHPSAAALMNKLPGIINSLDKGMVIDRFNLLDMNKEVIFTEPLAEWLCMRRSDLLLFLESLLSDVDIHYNCRFHHFEEKDHVITKAVFEDGNEVEGDVFFGCDGAHSLVRKALFGEVAFSPVAVKEIVSLVESEEYAQQYKGIFTKYIDPSKNTAFGFIPCNEKELVWFMQFDARLQTGDLNTVDEIATFARKLTADFPDCVTGFLAQSSFNNSYIWHSTDFDVLPAFHKNNVVLLGDAAHLALPFSSAGVANALTDSAIVASLLQKNNYDLETSFTQYYQARAAELKIHVKQGRELQESFLNHQQVKKMVPLIQNLESTDSID